MLDSDEPKWWTDENISRYFGNSTIAAATARSLLAQIAELQAKLAEMQMEVEAKDNYIALILNKNRMAIEMLSGYDLQVRELAEKNERLQAEWGKDTDEEAEARTDYADPMN